MIYEFAQEHDINSWLALLELVKDSFPGLNITEYIKALPKCIADKEALVAKEGDAVIGALAFSHVNNELSFLAVHPNTVITE